MHPEVDATRQIQTGDPMPTAKVYCEHTVYRIYSAKHTSENHVAWDPPNLVARNLLLVTGFLILEGSVEVWSCKWTLFCITPGSFVSAQSKCRSFTNSLASCSSVPFSFIGM